ncbi:unnamed protein product [Heterobilharzia americana]|nr:unnamed protein product [Heterobilharzia americana]
MDTQILLFEMGVRLTTRCLNLTYTSGCSGSNGIFLKSSTSTMNLHCFNTLIILVVQLHRFVSGAFNNEHYNQASFRTKRELHLSELARILNEVPTVQQEAVAVRLFDTIINILEESYKLLRDKDVHIETKNDTIGQAFALTFENTAVLCDLILRFPDAYHSKYSQINSVSNLLKWSFNLLRESKLMSKSDENVLHLTEQELNFIPRDINYVNEFSSRQKMIKEKLEADEARKASKLAAKRQKHVKKPRITPLHREL